MCPIQDKNQVVIKVACFGLPLVAFQASGAEKVYVFHHERGIGLGVASLAIYGFDSVNGSLMTIIAGHFAPIKICLVSHQAEFGEAIMIKQIERHAGNFGVAPGMIGVASLTALGVYQMAV